MQRPLHILVLAAGSSSRMAPRDKLLETVGGQPLLARIVRLALDTGVRVTVVLRPDRPLRLAALSGLPVNRVMAADADRGMAESLKAGLASLPEEVDVMLLLADLPELTLADLNQMVAAHGDHPDVILRATSAQGVPGHPVILPADLRPALMALAGDAGARQILTAHQHRIRGVPLPDNHAITDLDTPEAWATWRREQQVKGS